MKKPIGPVKGRHTVVEIDGILYLRLTPEEPEPESEKTEVPEPEIKEEPKEAANQAGETKKVQETKKGKQANKKQQPRKNANAGAINLDALECELEFDIGPSKTAKKDNNKDNNKEATKGNVGSTNTAAFEEKLNEDGIPLWFVQLERDIAAVKNPVPKRKPQAKKSMYSIHDRLLMIFRTHKS